MEMLFVIVHVRNPLDAAHGALQSFQPEFRLWKIQGLVAVLHRAAGGLCVFVLGYRRDRRGWGIGALLPYVWIPLPRIGG